MTMTAITEKLSVAGGPALLDFQKLKSAGVETLVNVRPDNEVEAALGTQAQAKAADDAGLHYVYIPVTSADVTEADIRAFQAAVRGSQGAVVARCLSGTRGLMLHVLGEVLDGRMQAEEVIAFGASRGFDLTAADIWLKKRAHEKPQVTGFFDKRTWSVQYVVSDPETGRCAIVDPVLDFDEKSGATATRSADVILDYVSQKGLTVEWILDTHPHADHFSAAHYLKQKTGARTAIGERVVEVQKLWKNIYNLPDLTTNGSQWDRLFADGDTFHVGSIEARVIFSPGHTLASVTYVIGDAAFVHDTIFMPDSGTARADFPGGDARVLWSSIQAILALPDETRLFTGHDYQPEGRAPRWESTVGKEKQQNSHLAGMTEEGFVKLRNERDKTLPMPKLILHALQVNIRGGRLPEPEANGRRYLKFPLNALEGAAW